MDGGMPLRGFMPCYLQSVSSAIACCVCARERDREHKPLMIPLFSFIALSLVGLGPLLSAAAELWHHSMTDSFY